MKKLTPKDHLDILEIYINVTDTVENTAKKYGVTVRTIERVVKKHGAIRTVAQANKATAHLKDYSGMLVPGHLKVKRKSLSPKTRYEVMMAHPFCSICGNTKEILPLEVDHIDNNPSNNDISNLQVLCTLCNKGKAYSARLNKEMGY